MDQSSDTTESAYDLAAAILEAKPGRDQMQLHKLLYLIQAASLAWFNMPIFEDRIEAWRYGPVVRGVAGHYKDHDRWPIPAPASGDSANLSARSRAIVERIIETYGDLSGPELAELTKQQGSPWEQVRADLPANEDSQIPINIELMTEYHRTFGVTPAEPSDRIAELAERFLLGDHGALVDLMEEATGVRPTVA